MAAEKAYSNLEISVQDALKHRSEWFEGVHNCKETDSLWTVMEAIVKAEVKSNQIKSINYCIMFFLFWVSKLKKILILNLFFFSLGSSVDDCGRRRKIKGGRFAFGFIALFGASTCRRTTAKVPGINGHQH